MTDSSGLPRPVHTVGSMPAKARRRMDVTPVQARAEPPGKVYLQAIGAAAVAAAQRSAGVKGAAPSPGRTGDEAATAGDPAAIGSVPARWKPAAVWLPAALRLTAVV